jgi:spore germination protein
LQAFVLAGAPDSLIDLQAHGDDVGVVYPTLFQCAPGTGRVVEEGSEAEVNASAAGIDAYAHAHDIAVMPRFNCQDGATVHLILTDPRVRASVLAGLAKIAGSNAYAGLNLDFENDVAADRAALTSFATLLARELHVRGRKLSVDVDGVTHEDAAASTGFYDDRALADVADYVFVIAWGTHWEGSAPGPLAPLAYVAAVAHHLSSLPHANRFVLGVPMYGLDWPIPAGAAGPASRPAHGPRAGTEPSPPATALRYTQIAALANEAHATPLLDRAVDEPTFAYLRGGVEHRVWYMDAQAIADRLQVAHAYGLQAGLWRLGGEDQALWSSPFA